MSHRVVRPGRLVWTVATTVVDPSPNRTVAGERLPGGTPGHLTLEVALADGVDVTRVLGRLRAAVEQLDVDLRTAPP